MKRFVAQDMEGIWSLSPTGAGPATITAHANWRNVYAVPGDQSSGPTIFHKSKDAAIAAGQPS